jgi:Ca2+-binding RTX toxin-like protein
MNVSASKKNHVQLAVEPLEEREVLSGIYDGVLVIHGTDQKDRVVIKDYQHPKTRIEYLRVEIVNQNGVEIEYHRPNRVQRIFFDGRAGDDEFKYLCNIPGRTVPLDLFGGAGDDRLSGGPEIDNIFGDYPDPRMFPGYTEGRWDARDEAITGNDQLWGFGGNDNLSGGRGTDVLRGGVGDDRLYGNDGLDHLFGEADNDLLFGGVDGFRDQMTGGSGGDMFLVEWYQSGPRYRALDRFYDYTPPHLVDLFLNKHDRIFDAAKADIAKGKVGMELFPSLHGNYGF